MAEGTGHGRDSRHIRMMTYNVRSLRDDRHAVARVIRACDPDVVCVQEAPRFWRWRARCAGLARESGLVVATGGRSAGAMLLLTSLRMTVRRTEDVLLRKRPRLHQRGLAMAVLEVDGARLGVASMHLSLDAREREHQVLEVLGHLARLGTPWVVLAGDVNESPNGPRWRALTRSLGDAHALAPWGGAETSPADRPVRRIDGVFVTEGLEVVRCGVPIGLVTEAEMARASDHRPVVADIAVPVAGG